MYSAIPRVIGGLAIVAGLVMLSGCQQSGIVVDTEDGKLMVADPNGDNARTYEVAADAKITLDGREAMLDDLEPGDSVNVVTAKHGEEIVAAQVTATSQEKAATPAEEGEPEESDATPDEDADVPLPGLEPTPIPIDPEEGAPPMNEGGGAAVEEPKLEGEATPPAEDQPTEEDESATPPYDETGQDN